MNKKVRVNRLAVIEKKTNNLIECNLAVMDSAL